MSSLFPKLYFFHIKNFEPTFSVILFMLYYFCLIKDLRLSYIFEKKKIVNNNHQIKIRM